ncbi:unnamed protein product [Prorocentrum cordatum]|uniref:Uncharacterized protein n=1 Tax=Prorocentrum cordatum TaxID=2364126 RepID=A0ABN9Y3B8_9DINO|nr:unnamed protein product [Polarella glacialis]
MPPQRKLLRRASALTLAAGACRLACRNGAASAAFAPGAAAAAPARAAADRADAERDADARVLANALRGARDARFSDLEPRARSGGYIAEAAPEMALNPPWATCYVEVQQATSSVLEERAWRGAVTCETVATFEGCWEEEPGVGHARRARRGRVVQRLEALLGGAYERQVRGHLRGGRPSGRVSGVRRQRRGVRRPREGLLQKRPGLAGLSPAGIQRHWQRLARHTRPCEAAAGGAGLCTTGPWHSGVAASAFVRYALWRHTAESSVNDSVGFEVLTGGAKRCSQSFNRVRGYPDECEWRAAKAAFEFASPFHPVQLRSSCHLAVVLSSSLLWSLDRPRWPSSCPGHRERRADDHASRLLASAAGEWCPCPRRQRECAELGDLALSPDMLTSGEDKTPRIESINPPGG